MTIDEAIKKAREKSAEMQLRAENAQVLYVNPKNCMKSSREYEQIAEWLEELKKLRERIEIQKECMTDSYLLGKYDGMKQGRKDAIDEYKSKLFERLFDDGLWRCATENDIDELAEQLKKK